MWFGYGSTASAVRHEVPKGAPVLRKASTVGETSEKSPSKGKGVVNLPVEYGPSRPVSTFNWLS